MDKIIKYTTDQSLCIEYIEKELNTKIESISKELEQIIKLIKKERSSAICVMNCIATLDIELKKVQMEETVAHMEKFIPGNTKDNSDDIYLVERKIKSIKYELELEYIKKKAIFRELDKNVTRKNELVKPIRELRIIITRIYNSIINTMTLLQSLNYISTQD